MTEPKNADLRAIVESMVGALPVPGVEWSRAVFENDSADEVVFTIYSRIPAFLQEAPPMIHACPGANYLQHFTLFRAFVEDDGAVRAYFRHKVARELAKAAAEGPRKRA